MNRIEELITAIKHGEMVILLDDHDRENEGDIVVAAEKVTYNQLNFILQHSSGIICLALSSEYCEKLDLRLMAEKNESKSKLSPNFTVSIEAAVGVTTGVSVADRLTTIKTAVKAGASADDFSKPGHVFPIRAEDGGVLTRHGHTEASVDLAKLAGLKPAAVICELMNTDGTMMRYEALMDFAKEHKMKIGTVADLKLYLENN